MKKRYGARFVCYTENEERIFFFFHLFIYLFGGLASAVPRSQR